MPLSKFSPTTGDEVGAGAGGGGGRSDGTLIFTGLGRLAVPGPHLPPPGPPNFRSVPLRFASTGLPRPHVHSQTKHKPTLGRVVSSREAVQERRHLGQEAVANHNLCRKLQKQQQAAFPKGGKISLCLWGLF